MLTFDIETMRNGSMVDRLPEPKVKTGNLKDPVKIAEKIREAKADQIDKMALNPLYGRVCAAVFIGLDDNAIRLVLKEDSDTAETELVEDILRWFTSPLVTYNGTGFDLPFVYRRAVVLGIDIQMLGLPPLTEMTARYNNKKHIDLMTAWCGYGQYEKLDNISKALFGDQKIEIDFREFPELIKTEAGREKLLNYCEKDVRLTQRFLMRCIGVLF
jgi:DNA polymerase elongation subunit (family B)